MVKRVNIAGLLLAIGIFASNSSARAQTPTDHALEQQGLADLFGKKNLKGGYYYAYEIMDGDRQKLIWLPWGLMRETSDNSSRAFVFFRGYNLFKVNCSDKENIDGVCIDGGNAQKASLKIIAYSLSGEKTTVVAKSSDPLSVSAWEPPLTSENAKVYDFGNGYTGILVKSEDAGQGEVDTFDSIFLCRNGKIRDAGLLTISGNNEGALGADDPSYYSFDSTVAFGEAAPGMPKSIILTVKGTARIGKQRAVEPINKVAVYAFNGLSYSGPPSPNN